MTTNPIDPANIGAYVAAAQADNDKRLQTAVAMFVLAYTALVNDDTLSVDEREALIQKLTDQAKSLQRSVTGGASVNEAFTSVFGISSDTGGGAAGELDVVNKDVAESIFTLAKRELPNYTPSEAQSIALVANDLLSGRLGPIHGDTLKVFQDLKTAISEKEEADQKAKKATEDLEATNRAVTKIQTEIKGALGYQEVTIGSGLSKQKQTVLIVDISKLTADGKKFLGL